ncbi:BPSS1780 family membrane protein [Catenovulum maritimum]|uniref:Glycerophosphoryl diester phosphodiesterase membrane domain-containing protein n=1 Tax=Catenovulum maritimum TaxID=1513271 RepID=A0A0J8GSB4_9ALTE|nr:BPSS1780 family membrane protein [Catenovulum maritimum]KMT64189.1 hypothetical protein XM47_15585 [Catenovulum maritimum]
MKHTEKTGISIKIKPAKNAFDWLTQGYNLFNQKKLFWIVTSFIVYFASLLIAQVPILGGLVASLLLSSLLVIAQMQDNNVQIDSKPIINIIKTKLFALTHLFIFNIISGAIASYLALISLNIDMSDVKDNQTLASFYILTLCFYIPFLFCFLFSPALILFNNLKAVDAMKHSFTGCFKNSAPLIIFGILSFFLFILAALLFGLGLLVLLPVLHCSLYMIYKDIFLSRTEFSMPKPSDEDDSGFYV